MSFDTSQWMPDTPQLELYRSYEGTIAERFPAFGVRPYDEVLGDLESPLLPRRNEQVVEQWILDSLVTASSFEVLQGKINEHAQQFGLDDWLEHEGSIAYALNHRQFTDVPVTAEALGRIGLTDRNQSLQVVSKMVSMMTLGDLIIIDELRKVAPVAQTVPRLDGKPSAELREYRKRTNTYGIETIEAALATKGAVIVESFIGRHDQPSADGKTLRVHEPNWRTGELLAKPEVKVVPVYVECLTFGPNGQMEPAEAYIRLFDPIHFREGEARAQTKYVTQLLFDETGVRMRSSFENGVELVSFRNQLMLRR